MIAALSFCAGVLVGIVLGVVALVVVIVILELVDAPPRIA